MINLRYSRRVKSFAVGAFVCLMTFVACHAASTTQTGATEAIVALESACNDTITFQRQLFNWIEAIEATKQNFGALSSDWPGLVTETPPSSGTFIVNGKRYSQAEIKKAHNHLLTLHELLQGIDATRSGVTVTISGSGNPGRDIRQCATNLGG